MVKYVYIMYISPSLLFPEINRLARLMVLTVALCFVELKSAHSSFALGRLAYDYAYLLVASSPGEIGHWHFSQITVYLSLLSRG